MAAVPDVEYRLLGAVEVWRKGTLIVLRRAATINLLAGLLVSANELVSAARLAEITWGNRQPEHPRAALHTKMSRLRDILGAQTIRTVGGGYVLTVSPGQLDLRAFDDRIVKAREFPGPEAAGLLEAAIALWRGTPLSNADSLILQSEVVQPLIARYLAACESWANLRLRLGQPHQVVDRLGPLVAAHPFRESLTGQLMLALYRANRSADALTAYESLRTALREELGADPGASLQGLYLSILRNTLPELHIPVEAQQMRLTWAGRGPSPAGLNGAGPAYGLRPRNRLRRRGGGPRTGFCACARCRWHA
jgi:DNA-binding SARP family transcriptional activator